VILVPPRSPAAIRVVLDELVSRQELAEALGAAARARLERSYSWGSVVDRYREIYRSHA
jgi:glycosyltransferase involved in cell wall biosynthesis